MRAKERRLKKMKYKIIVYWNSGYIEAIDCESLTIAKICMEALREEYNIRNFGLREFKNGKWEII